ncbi:MAG: glycosyltransferase [Candidatus Magasanikbacteria bacterium]
MKTLVFLYSPKQISIIKSGFLSKKNLKKDARIITLDHEIEIELRKKNIPFTSITEYFNSPPLPKKLEDKVSKAVNKFLKIKEAKQFKHKNVNILHYIGKDTLDHVIRDILYNILLFTKILKRNKKTKEIIVPEKEKNDGFNPTIEAGKLVSEKFNVELNTFSHQKKDNNEKKNKLKKIKKWILGKLLKVYNFLITLTAKKDKNTLLILNHWDRVKQIVHNLEGWEIIMARKKELKKIKLNDLWKYKIRFYHPEEFIKEKTKKNGRLASKWKKIQQKTKKFESIFSYKNINYWPIVKQYIENFLKQKNLNIIQKIEGMDALFRNLFINKLLLRTAIKREYYIAAKIASKLNITSIELQHGMISPERIFCWNPDKVKYFAGYGKKTKEYFNKNYSNSKNFKIIEVGSSRFEKYLRPTPRKVKKSLINKLGFNYNSPIITIVLPTPKGYLTTYHIKEFFQAIKNIQEENNNLQLILKIREGEKREKYFKKLIKKHLKNQNRVKLVRTINVEGLLAISSLIFSSKSTVNLEAMIMGKPLVVYTFNQDKQISNWAKKRILKHVVGYEKTGETISKILENEKEREKICRNANIFLKENYKFDENSSKRVAKLLSRKKTK